MSGFRLCVTRCWQDMRFQTKTIHSVIDWTIVLYLIIPGIAIFFTIYRSWWYVTPVWMEGIPILVMFLILYVLCWIGGYRTFLQEADQLFLLQKKRLVGGLKLWGILFCVVLHGAGMFLAFTLLSPFLIGYYSLSWAEVFLLLLYYSISKWLILLLKSRLGGIPNRWLKAFLTFILFCSMAFPITIISLRFVEHTIVPLLIATLVFLILFFIQVHSWITTHSTALVDMDQDRKQKLKYAQFILVYSEYVPKPTLFSRKRPWLFRNSGRIYQKRSIENGFVGLFIKIFIRNGSHSLSYLQIVGVSISAIIVLPPIWLKWTMYVLFLFFMKKWLDSIWSIVTSKPLLAPLLPDQERMFIAKKRVSFLFLTPGYVFVGLIALLSTMFTYLF